VLQELVATPPIMASHTEKHVSTHIEIDREESNNGENIKIADIRDGDLALKILHTHYEPFTKDEERRVLRKIDLRLALLMLVVNGLQFVDKLVRPYCSLTGTID
jgi:hypothetical protein